MKILNLKFTLALIASSLCMLHCVAQSDSTAITPEYLNQPYWKDGPSLRPLEANTAKYKGKFKITGFESTKVLLKIAGKESPVSISSQNSLQFVVKIGVESSDVSFLFQLYKATVKGKTREALYTAITLGGKTKKNDALVRYTVKEVGHRTYQLSLPAGLESGEYFFLYTVGYRQGSGEAEVFCFSLK